MFKNKHKHLRAVVWLCIRTALIPFLCQYIWQSGPADKTLTLKILCWMSSSGDMDYYRTIDNHNTGFPIASPVHLLSRVSCLCLAGHIKEPYVSMARQNVQLSSTACKSKCCHIHWLKYCQWFKAIMSQTITYYWFVSDCHFTGRDVLKNGISKYGDILVCEF